MKKKFLNIAIVVLLTIVVLYVSLKDNFSETIRVLFNVKIIWIVLAYIFVLIYTFLKSIITNKIINSFKKYKLKNTFKLQLMTFFFNAITPFSTGGQPFQVYVLKKNKLSLSQSTNVVLQESIIHQLAFSFVVFISIVLNMIFKIYKFDSIMMAFLVIGFLLNIALIVSLFLIAYGKKIGNIFGEFFINILYRLRIIKDKEKRIDKWQNSIKNFTSASKGLLENKSRFLWLVLLNIIAIVSLYLTPSILLFGLNGSINLLTSIVLVAFVSIIGCYVPLPGGSLGQEYLFVLFFGVYVQNSVLSSLMILWRFVTYYLPMILGAIVFNISKKGD